MRMIQDLNGQVKESGAKKKDVWGPLFKVGGIQLEFKRATITVTA